MKSLKIVRTLKCWVTSTDFLFCQNTTTDLAETKLTELINKNFSSYIQIPMYMVRKNGLKKHQDSKGCKKLYVYGWRWRGEWADPTKELAAVFYLPKSNK